MEPAEALRAFIAKRAKLIHALDESRIEIDAWLATSCPDEGASLHELATLAGIIEMRRDYLLDLTKLDDEFLQNIQAFAAKAQRVS